MWLPYTLGARRLISHGLLGPLSSRNTFSHPEQRRSLLVLKAFEDTAFGVVPQSLITERPCLRGCMIARKPLWGGLSSLPPSQGPLFFTPLPAFISCIVARGRRPGQAGVWSPLDKQPQHQPRNEDCALKARVHQVIKTQRSRGRHFRGFGVPTLKPWTLANLLSLWVDLMLRNGQTERLMQDGWWKAEEAIRNEEVEGWWSWEHVQNGRRSEWASGGAEPRHPHPAHRHHCLKGTNMETQKVSYFRSFSFSSFYYSEVRVESREFLAVQWLGLQISTVGDTGSIPGWRTKIDKPQRTAKNNNNDNKGEQFEGRTFAFLSPDSLFSHPPSR